MSMKTYRKKAKGWGLVFAICCVVLAVAYLSGCGNSFKPDLTGLRPAGYLVNGEQVVNKPATAGYFLLYTTDQIEAAVAVKDCKTLRATYAYVADDINAPHVEHDGPLATYTDYVMGQIC